MPRWLSYILIGVVVVAAVIGFLFLFGVFDDEAEAAIPPILVLPPATTTTVPETTTTVEETTTTVEETTTTVEETTTTVAETTTTVEETTTTEAPTTTTTVPPTTTTTAPPVTTTTAPPVTTTTAPPVTTTTLPAAPPESILVLEEFLDLFNEAVANDNLEWLYDHLNPIVIEVYDEASCRALVEFGISDFVGLALAGPVLGPHTQAIAVEPGVVVPVDNLYVADVSFTWNGEPGEGPAWFHINPVTTGLDSPVTYFAACDQPVIQPR